MTPRFPLLSSFLLTLSITAGQPSLSPAILSTLYGYDDCIGGVNNFDTEEEYFLELKRRNCTVVTGPDGKEVTNVVSSIALKTRCGLLGTWEWMDGMPLTFNFPMAKSPDKSAFQLELNDGSVTSPTCVMEAPANENNELDTLLLLGQFGDGMRDGIWPISLRIIGEVVLSGPGGELDAEGLVFESPLDMRYTHSSVRMVYARMWDVNDFDEGDRYPTWPLPSSTYPNNCQSLFPSTSHIIRVGFSGGVTRDGVLGVTPDQQNVFSLSTVLGQQVTYLGLADLGKTVTAQPGHMYEQDGDNYMDVCLDLSSQPEASEEDLLLDLLCQVALLVLLVLLPLLFIPLCPPCPHKSILYHTLPLCSGRRRALPTERSSPCLSATAGPAHP